MLQNAYLLAKIGADTAENERNFAEILSKFCNCRRAVLDAAVRAGHVDPVEDLPFVVLLWMYTIDVIRLLVVDHQFH